jgi:hypothetical protein
MFYLIGVNHNSQSHLPGATLDRDQAELQRCLEISIEKYRPNLIAVEESDETLLDKKKGVTYESIPRNVAEAHGIESIFCEPSGDEKRRIGYKDQSQIHLELFTSGLLRDCPPGLEAAAAHAVAISLIFPLREEFWIEKLRKHNQLEVVFVLGEDHLDTFCRRLEGLGIQSKVLFRGIGVTAAQMCEIEAARRFPAEAPDLFEAMIKGMRERDLRLQGC